MASRSDVPTRDLRRLSELRAVLADDQPDIRGWPVYTVAAHGGPVTAAAIGTVADLLVDTTAGEVVMLDIDLRYGGRHTFAPLSATRIDGEGRRVLLDAYPADDPARAAARASAAPATPEPATGEPPINEAVVDEAVAGEPPAGGLPFLVRNGPLTDEDIRRFDEAYVRAYGDRGAGRDANWRVRHSDEAALQFAGAGAVHAAPTPTAADRRAARVDDASALDDSAAIEPRELDALVRLEEGGTVDDTTPVAAVRYGAEPHPAHDYGRPDEAYGPGYGSGRIGFDHIVSRHPWGGEADDVAEVAGPVRYRGYAEAEREPGPRA